MKKTLFLTFVLVCTMSNASLAQPTPTPVPGTVGSNGFPVGTQPNNGFPSSGNSARGGVSAGRVKSGQNPTVDKAYPAPGYSGSNSGSGPGAGANAIGSVSMPGAIPNSPNNQVSSSATVNPNTPFLPAGAAGNINAGGAPASGGTVNPYTGAAYSAPNAGGTVNPYTGAGYTTSSNLNPNANSTTAQAPAQYHPGVNTGSSPGGGASSPGTSGGGNSGTADGGGGHPTGAK